MPLIYLFLLSFVFTSSPKPTPPLKIAVLYFSPIDRELKAALLQNITATYRCMVSEIKGIAAMPVAAYYKRFATIEASMSQGCLEFGIISMCFGEWMLFQWDVWMPTSILYSPSR